MKKIIWAIGFWVCANNYAQEYVYQPCPGFNNGGGKDTLLLSDGYYFLDPIYCNTDLGETIVEKFTDPQKDSLNKALAILLEPYFGKWVNKVEPVEITTFMPIDEENNWMADDDKKICSQVKFLIRYKLSFNDGAMLCFQIQLDKDLQILNPEELPELDNIKNWEVISPCDIFRLASNNKYFGKSKASPNGVDLGYSYELDIFYYKVYCSKRMNSKAYAGKEGYTESFYEKILFIDAFTGKILWKTRAYTTIITHHAVDTRTGMNYNHPLIRKPKKKKG